MLSSSYLHVPGVGPLTERRIWDSGLLTWDQFLSAPAPDALSPRMAARITDAVTLSRDHLRQDDFRFFASRLPSREHWRAFPEFSHRIAYLDIETTGMEGHDVVTMIGLYDGSDVRAYTRGEDLDEFFEDIGRFGLLVTFFGSGFDLPFLCRRFPDLTFDHLHIDLCHAMRRLGLTGGLKNIERHLGIARASETEGL
ncbi:MAG: ribonuclease H-like domain-containing protein, partial [Armatimonadetes bacterium]|nr:ribonuclease H-like domain-containing protein [Armatimonadota bacterium]